MKALILVDIQNDFLAGGALAVPNGNEVIAVANQRIGEYEFVVATQDWHPPNHGSFASVHDGVNVGDQFELNGLPQIAWPDHCIQNTSGAELASELNRDGIDAIVQKGTDTSIDSYSGFFDNGKRKSTGLGELLKDKGVPSVDVLGLATTALDAAELGFQVTLLLDGCRGVNLRANDVDHAVAEMKTAGVEIC